MKVIGITGGIACGKSFVTRLFARYGAKTASADDDARAVAAPGSPALVAILRVFPEARTPEGALDRTTLARRIFSDPDARQQLEAITHPAIRPRIESTLRNARSADDAPLFVYEIPLLFERGYETLLDATVAVTCSPSIQATRLQEREALAGRPPLTDAQITERLAAQLSGAEKAARADYVIHTDGSIPDTEAQTLSLYQKLTGSIPNMVAV